MEASTQDKKALQVNMVLTALETNKQELATEINTDRSSISKVLSGKRVGAKIRGQLVEAICARIKQLILPPSEEQSVGKKAA